MVRKGVLAPEEGHGSVRGRADVGLGAGRKVVDALDVTVPHLLQGEQMPMCLAKSGDACDPLLGARRCLSADAPDQTGDVPLGLGERIGCPLRQFPHAPELVQHLSSGDVHLVQRGPQIPGLHLAQPVVGVGDAGACGDESLVQLGGLGRLGDLPGDGQAVGQAADQVGVADPGKRPGACRGRSGIRVGDVGAPPDLHDVHTGRLFGVRCAQDDECAVVEEGVALAGERVSHLLADLVVGQKQAAALAAGAEGVEHVLSVG